MKRHDTDWTSLIAGLTFAVIAVAYLGGEITGRSLELRWVAPLLLIGLGAAGVAGTLVRARRQTAPVVEAPRVVVDAPPVADESLPYSEG
jgi:hypothetical protein